MVRPAGEAKSNALQLDFDRRSKPRVYSSSVNSDAGLLAYRELSPYPCMFDSDRTALVRETH